MVAPRCDDLRWLDQAATRRLRGCLICSCLARFVTPRYGYVQLLCVDRYHGT